ncbi:MAG: InlB B-repeat-containing protein [Eubacterium sp.]|nr:InlB B-repeat-containing protein [Eubacterium sp.]
MIRTLIKPRHILSVLLLALCFWLPGISAEAAADSTPPTIDNLTISPENITDDTEALKVSMDLGEEETGVSSIRFALTRKSGNRYEAREFYVSTNTPLMTGRISRSISLKEWMTDLYGLRTGSYDLDQICIYDEAGNTRVYSRGPDPAAPIQKDEKGYYLIDENDPSVKCHFTGNYTVHVIKDTQKYPVLTGFQIVDGTVADKGSAITVRLNVENLQYLDYAHVVFIGGSAYKQMLNWNGEDSPMVPVDKNTVLIRVPVPMTYSSGKYDLHEIRLVDKYGEITYHYEPETGRLVDGDYSIPVEEKDTSVTVKPSGDEEAPVIKGIHIDTPTLIKPGVIKISADTEDETGIALAECVLAVDGGTNNNCLLFEKEYTDKIKDRKITFTLPVSNNTSSGNYYIRMIRFTDFSGNQIEYNASDMYGNFYKDAQGRFALFPGSTDPFFVYPPIEVKEEFDYAFETNIKNPSLVEKLKEMPEGKTAKVLLIDGENNQIARKELFMAIQGKDKTIVFAYRDFQWIFNGKNITSPKDVNLMLSVSVKSGADYGAKGNIIGLTFPENGQLPGQATVRFKCDYLRLMHNLTGSLYLYYVNPSTESLSLEEDSGIRYYLDDTDHWCSFDINHNSRYIASGSQLNKNKNIKGKKFTFKYDANGGKASAKSKKVTGGKTFGKLASASRKGYSFEGWYTERTGGTKVTKGTVAAYMVKTLYAHWKINTYKISYKYNGGSLAEGSVNPASYTVIDSVSFLAPEKTGYRFAGWYKDKKLKKKASGIGKGSTGNKTFYAKWTANTYKLTFAGNGASKGSMKAQSFTYGKSKAISANRYSKKGYSFSGWALSETGPVAYKNKQKVKNLTSKHQDTIPLYAAWKINTYKITYKYNGGRKVDENDNPATYTVEDEVTLAEPVKEGYTFAGWYKDKKFKKKVTSISAGSTGNKTFYAKWKK